MGKVVDIKDKGKFSENDISVSSANLHKLYQEVELKQVKELRENTDKKIEDLVHIDSIISDVLDNHSQSLSFLDQIIELRYKAVQLELLMAKNEISSIKKYISLPWYKKLFHKYH